MWVIQDWMSKRVFPEVSFPSFQEARDYISEYANSVADTEEELDGIEEDLYAVWEGEDMPEEGFRE